MCRRSIAKYYSRIFSRKKRSTYLKTFLLNCGSHCSQRNNVRDSRLRPNKCDIYREIISIYRAIFWFYRAIFWFYRAIKKYGKSSMGPRSIANTFWIQLKQKSEIKSRFYISVKSNALTKEDILLMAYSGQCQAIDGSVFKTCASLNP